MRDGRMIWNACFPTWQGKKLTDALRATDVLRTTDAACAATDVMERMFSYMAGWEVERCTSCDRCATHDRSGYAATEDEDFIRF